MDDFENLQPSVTSDPNKLKPPLLIPDIHHKNIADKEHQKHVAAQVAFVDGMMHTFSLLLKNNAYKFYKNYNLSELMTKHDNLLYKLSKGYCGEASANLLHYLHQKHPKLYDRFLIIRSNHGPFINESWEAHQVAFVREKGTNQWYAGSPANYSSEKDANYSDTVYAGSIPDIMTELEKDYLGTWPDKAQINELIARQYQSPTESIDRGDKKIGVYTIDTTYAPIDKSMRSPNLSVKDIPILTRSGVKSFGFFS